MQFIQKKRKKKMGAKKIKEEELTAELVNRLNSAVKPQVVLEKFKQELVECISDDKIALPLRLACTFLLERLIQLEKGYGDYTEIKK